MFDEFSQHLLIDIHSAPRGSHEDFHKALDFFFFVQAEQTKNAENSRFIHPSGPAALCLSCVSRVALRPTAGSKTTSLTVACSLAAPDYHQYLLSSAAKSPTRICTRLQVQRFFGFMSNGLWYNTWRQNAEKMQKECSLIDRNKRETNNCVAGCSGYNARHRRRVLMAAELTRFHANSAAHPQ